MLGTPQSRSLSPELLDLVLQLGDDASLFYVGVPRGDLIFLVHVLQNAVLILYNPDLLF